MNDSPRVSVVIPTYNRPEELREAVTSVFAQSFQDFEVVVTVDGGGSASAAALKAFPQERLRVLTPQSQLGNAEARNHAIRAASGELIALLDDDDLWKPEKLKKQVALYDAVGEPRLIVSCPFEVRSEAEHLLWPQRRPEPDEPVSEYIFCRHRSVAVEGAVQTSTLLAAKALFDDVPFDKNLPRMVDLDWLLRAAEAGAPLAFTEGDEALSVYAVDDSRVRVSHQARWQWEREFARERRHLFTDRSYAAFMLTSCSLAASRSNDPGAFLPLLATALREGRPSMAELAFHMANTALPLPLKRRLAALLARKKPA
ncbi:glycosyltransferase family 2 protein [Parvularcula maris]|uniref:Glycosyltransferase n=1 Tax=Parvularcula maris TaxID=2965077 RepID=A0A9X2RJV5_9PROT|nr:glycosyltransferase [Parvularcula maris]MCQ8186316.1 glycosyltransferase [Parvularcula maris]